MTTKKAKKPKTSAKTKKAKRSVLGIFGRFFLLASIWGSICLGIIILWFAQDLPDLNRLQTIFTIMLILIANYIFLVDYFYIFI